MKGFLHPVSLPSRHATQAESDLRTALGIIHPAATPGVSLNMDITNGDTPDNQYLLAVSCILLEAAREMDPSIDGNLQQLLNTIASDLEIDGQLAAALVQKLITAEKSLDPALCMNNVTAWFAKQGITNAVPNIFHVVDSDKDGTANASDLDDDNDGVVDVSDCAPLNAGLGVALPDGKTCVSNQPTPKFTSPASGSTLASSVATFSWTANTTPVTEWWLYIGSNLGERFVYDSGSLGVATTKVVSELPMDGRQLFLRLWYKSAGLWKYIDDVFVAAGSGSPLAPAMTTPVSGSTLSSTSQLFNWIPQSTVVTEWWLYVGTTRGNFDLHTSGSLSAATLSKTVGALPNNGMPIYVRLWFKVAGKWRFTDAEYASYSHCSNGIQDSDEIGIDCGGFCAPCMKNDLDGDGFYEIGGGDCNDTNASIFPGADEIPYDGVDQDCSGSDLVDVDQDGSPSMSVSGGTDCDDTNDNINPSEDEIVLDGVDQNCNGSDVIDDGVFSLTNYFNFQTGDDQLAVAFNGTRFLVVWVESSPIPRLKGQLVGLDGSLQSFVFIDNGNALLHPSIASDGNNFFIVVHQRIADVWHLNGLLISGTSGSPLLPLITIQSNIGSTGLGTSDVAFDGTNYLAVWHQEIPNSVGLKKINSLGVPENTSITVLNVSPYYYDAAPRIAADAASGNALIVYRNPPSISLLAKTFGASGLGTEKILSTNPSNNSLTVAYGANQFLTTWWTSQFMTGDDIFGQMTDMNGDPLLTNTTDNLAVSTAMSGQRSPDVAFCSGAFHTVFTDAGKISLQTMGTDGSAIGSSIQENITISHNGFSKSPPKVACGNGTLLIVWIDNGNGQQVRGKLVELP